MRAQDWPLIAAKISGRSESNFNARLVKTNAVTAVRVDGDHRRFFRKTDVKEVAARMKDLVGAADVRASLKLGESQLIRLTESGELKPVRGPKVDGFGHNLFSKHDVEIVREQREAFKRKRSLEGGSQRFGKPPGRRRSPVVEARTPRVRELITEAAADGTRMSAATIHKRLIKKGHKICITSVYVCIRKI